MTFTTAGYPGEVNKVEFAQMLAFFTLHGVKDLTVVPVAGADRTVRVTFSQAMTPGVFLKQTAPDDVQLPVNGSSFSRRDRIIFRHDWNSNTTNLVSKQGTPAASPALPSLTIDPGVIYEQHIAAVTVGPGQGELQPNDISLLGLSEPAPVVTLDDDSALPFTRFGALVISLSTGRMRVSDGATYHDLLAGDDTAWESQAATAAWAERNPGTIWRSRRNGIVYLRGALFRGGDENVWLADSHMFTLPAAWRPSQTIYGWCTQVWNEQQWFRLTVDTDGRGVVRVAGSEAIRSTLVQFTMSFPQF